MHKVAWEHSRRRANDMFEHDPKPTVRCAEYIYEMSKVADKWFALGLYMVSPRSFDVVELEIIDKFLDKGVPMWAGTMPIMGVNSPITEKAGIQQAMFETYACLTMLNLLNTKSYNYIQIIDSFIAHPFDMKYSTFEYGSAEDVRATVDKLSIHKHLKMPMAAKSLLTAAKEMSDLFLEKGTVIVSTRGRAKPETSITAEHGTHTPNWPWPCWSTAPAPAPPRSLPPPSRRTTGPCARSILTASATAAAARPCKCSRAPNV